MDLLNLTPKTDNIVVTLELSGKPVVNEDGSPMTITVMSPFSAEARAILHAMSDDRIKRAKERKDTSLSSAEVEEANLEGLVRTTVDWDITWGGEKVKFTHELAKEVYQKAFWIRPQVEEAKASTLDFMKP